MQYILQKYKKLNKFKIASPPVYEFVKFIEIRLKKKLYKNLFSALDLCKLLLQFEGIYTTLQSNITHTQAQNKYCFESETKMGNKHCFF